MDGIELKAELPSLDELIKSFRALDNRLAAKHMQPVLRKATKPALQRLRRSVRKGPTGNLRKAIATKFKKYVRDGGAVGLVGYENKREAYHQHLYEYGTQPRYTRGPVASSYKRRAFTVERSATPGAAGRNTLNPRSDFNFYYRSWTGRPVYTGIAMPRNSLEDAFESSLGTMRGIMRQEMSAQLEKAINEFVNQEQRRLR